MRMRLLLLPVIAIAFAANTFSQMAEAIKTTNRPDPVFPAEAKDLIYGEDVKVAISVDKKGKVNEARAYGPLAPCSNLSDQVAKTIRNAAVGAAMQTTFEPILKDGKPSEADLMISYRLRPKVVPLPDPEKKTIIGGVLNGTALSLPKPPYPEVARPSRVRGTVQVRILIAEDGSVIAAAALSGHPLLIDASVDTACKSRFAPTKLAGHPVKVTGVVVYNFIP